MKTVVMCDNPATGFHLTGPFDTVEEANGWADEHVAREYDWWAVPIAEPEELK